MQSICASIWKYEKQVSLKVLPSQHWPFSALIASNLIKQSCSLEGAGALFPWILRLSYCLFWQVVWAGSVCCGHWLSLSFPVGQVHRVWVLPARVEPSCANLHPYPSNPSSAAWSILCKVSLYTSGLQLLDFWIFCNSRHSRLASWFSHPPKHWITSNIVSMHLTVLASLGLAVSSS